MAACAVKERPVLEVDNLIASKCTAAGALDEIGIERAQRIVVDLREIVRGRYRTALAVLRIGLPAWQVDPKRGAAIFVAVGFVGAHEADLFG